MQQTAFQAASIPGRIDILMDLDPVQTRAFLIGLQSGYYLSKTAQQPTEATDEPGN